MLTKSIHEIKSRLENATNFVGKALPKNDHFKVLNLSFKKGMVLKEHRIHQPTILAVIEGKVGDPDVNTITALDQYNEF